MSAQAHGHTPAAWTGVVISFVGFCVSGAAMIMASVLLFWVGILVILGGGAVGLAMKMAGMGKQPNEQVEKYKAEFRAAREGATAPEAVTAGAH
ncbi:HGxxPAAW family protein [Kitasatospora azatica]|uniref:HGxxPAAW family protein n=1 Tax=Kitasatospora azatica TaxID=58347 RepID=UPI000562ACB7|nr:HGxxPAAW family protein [Kitasatospora azatica]